MKYRDENVDANNYSDFGRTIMSQEFKQIIEKAIEAL